VLDSLLLFALTVSSADGGFDAKTPSSWHFTARVPKDSDEYQALVKDFTRKQGDVGEQPLTEEEAKKLLDDPRAEAVYADKTISIVAPSMLVRQRQAHLDLMKAFLQPERLEAGAKFARDHQATLEKTEARTGVDRGVIVGILMWESKLCTITGDFVAFNAFISQAYFADDANAVAMADKAEAKAIAPADQKKRVDTIKERARRNLIALVRQCKAKGIDPLEVKGSWAGALGFPQFMPASLRWADDGNGDGKIDLFDIDDAIASIGKYLEQHGYKKSPYEAVYGYNHEDAYVKGVLAYGAALKKLLVLPDGGM
jgi:membrane-bound lytic murein transglycosylase B